MNIEKEQARIQAEVKKKFLSVNYNPSWIMKGLDSYFKKGKKS